MPRNTGRPDEADRRNLAEPFPRVVFLILGYQIPPYLLAQRSQCVQLLIVQLRRCASPLLLRAGPGSFQRDPAVAVIAGVATLTLTCFGFASSRFGMLRVNTPSL